ncbi:ead/Ea22-like family protein [Escherichia coli]|uniref:ead/Ea22-like family protein n=1 Tax=Escherichia coli TaxID=562 RepID=UPI0029164036|nr:ead/Ea22-like family protein [Escherichia coli]
MSKINYQALREAAEKALHGEWGYEAGAIWNTCDSGYVQHMAAVETGDDVSDEEHMSNMRFITLATPTVVLGLLDELSEAKAAEENESSCANSVINIAINWQMRAKDAEAKLEAAEKRIAELETKANQQTRISDKNLTRLIADADKMLGMRSPVVDSEWWTLLRQFLIELQDRRKNSISESGIRAETLNDLIRHIDRNVDIDAMKSPFELSSEIVDYVNKQLHKESA